MSNLLPIRVCCLVGLSFTCRDQAAQAVIDIEAPRARTATVTLEGRNQTDVCEAQFGLSPLPVDLKDDVGAVPFGSVFDKVDVAVHDMPDHFFAWHPFSNPLSRLVDVLIAVRELGAEPVCASVNFSRPPPTNVVDGVEDFFRRLLDRKGSRVTLGIHVFSPNWLPSHTRKRHPKLAVLSGPKAAN